MKTQQTEVRHSAPALGAACAYNAVGSNYLAYADGEAGRPFEFTGSYPFADREIWRRIDAELIRLATGGRTMLRLLDAGCGPGTWLRRASARARQLGFTRIQAHGFDISPAMIELAETQAMSDSATTVSFAVADLARKLPFADDEFDLTLCLYGVLNHLPASAHPAAAAELSRVTGGTLFVTVRTAGSLPTIYVDSISHARAFHQDNQAGWMDVELADGTRLGFPSHLFTSADLSALFRPHFEATAMHGLDVFHSRFAAHAEWNPQSLIDDPEFEDDLCELERRYASDVHFIDRAAHILLVAER